MGEENKEADQEQKNGGGGKDEKEEEKKKEEKNINEEANPEAEPPKEMMAIVLKVDMHCEACARKVAKSLKGFQGVEDVTTDCKASEVVVKGEISTINPLQVCQRIHKKTGRKVELVSPKPAAEEEDQNKEDEPKQEEKPPAVVTVVLKVGMHCEACAQLLQKKIRKIPGVKSAAADLANEQVVVKGVLDPAKLVNDIYKRTKKQASIMKDEDEKEEKGGDQKKDGNEGEDTKFDVNKNAYWPPKYNIDYAYAPQFFSDDNPNACSVM